MLRPATSHEIPASGTQWSSRRVFEYAELERIAAAGGYSPGQRDIHRITPADVHHLYAGLHQSGQDQAAAAMVAVGQLRHWLVHGDNRPPSVRGAGYARSDGEVWMTYTTHWAPALVRGKFRQMDDLRRYLAVTTTPDYDGSLGVPTEPPIKLEVDDGTVLRSPEGIVRLDAQQVLSLERSLSATLRRRDRRCVLCLPGAWRRG